MKNPPTSLALMLAFAAGALHWLLCALVVGGEAWDGGIYFVTLPLLGLAIGVLCAFVPGRPWSAGLCAAGAQALCLVLLAGEFGSMLPVGLMILAIFGLGLGACGWIGARLRNRLVTDSRG